VVTPSRVKSPRRIVGLALTLMFLPSVLLVGLGWQLYRLDWTGALQQLQERREQAADLAVATLEPIVTGVERALRTPAAWRGLADADDAVVVRFDRDRTDITGRGRLAYSPAPDPGHDPEAAVRAGALLRSARGLPLQRQLDLYAQMAQVRGAALEGVPAELLARYARCVALERAHHVPELRAEAQALFDDLRSGRWSISRAVYVANHDQAKEWLDIRGTDAALTPAEALAAAVESLAQTGRQDGATTSGRQVLRISGSPATVVSVADADTPVAFVALQSFVDREWLARAVPAADRQRFRLVLQDPLVRSVAATGARRNAAETGLPWTVTLVDEDQAAETAYLDARRSLWVAGLVTLGVLFMGGGYLVTRVVGRELAVARLQSDFVAAVSHEFRTPLTSMRQLTEILTDGRVAAEERRLDYYRALGRQTDRLQRLVENLLDFGRMEAGTSPYRLEPLDACALVRTVIDDFGHDAAGRGVHVDLEMAEGAAIVAGDRDALTNALWNLLDNAVKYSPDCPTVWVTVERSAGRLLIRVRDRGLGIPREEQRTIFDRFVRGTRARTEGIKGTGIGLAMVRHIVRAHGGEVDVDSAPGTGSTFTIGLPMGV